MGVPIGLFLAHYFPDQWEEVRTWTEEEPATAEAEAEAGPEAETEEEKVAAEARE